MSRAEEQDELARQRAEAELEELLPGIWMQAATCKQYYEDMLEQGFTKEQAFELVKATVHLVRS